MVGQDGTVHGIITMYDIKQYLFEKDSLKNILIADDISQKDFELIFPEENCQTALDKMGRAGMEGLPVAESNENKKLLGMIWRKDIQDAYQKEIEKREITDSLASSISMKDEEHNVHFMEGYSITEISPPKSFIGKSIRDLNIRAQYGVDVLSVKVKDKKGVKVKAIPNLFLKKGIQCWLQVK